MEKISLKNGFFDRNARGIREEAKLKIEKLRTEAYATQTELGKREDRENQDFTEEEYIRKAKARVEELEQELKSLGGTSITESDSVKLSNPT